MILDFSKAVLNEQYDIKRSYDCSFTLQERGITFAEPIAVDGWYILTDGTVGVKLALTTTLNCTCDNCLDEFTRRVNISLSLTYTPDGAENTYKYVGTTLDLSQAIEEAIILSIPPKLLCTNECKGLCPKCGVNRNKDKCSCSDTLIGSNNPFAILKSIAGGAENGITKK